MVRWLMGWVAAFFLASSCFVQAAVEVIDPMPVSSWQLIGNLGGPFSSPDAACLHYGSLIDSSYAYVGANPIPLGLDGNMCANTSGQVNCVFALRGVNLEMTSALPTIVCPTPVNHPTIPFTYHNAKVSNPCMCARTIPDQPECPIKALTPLPADDACTQALENLSSTQAQKDAACGTLTATLRAGKDCLKNKLSAATDLSGIPFVNTGGIRSLAYQAHFREIWDKMEEVVDEMERDPTMQTACAARRAEIAAEKGCDNAGPCESCFAQSAAQRSHCLNGRPAKANPNDAKHMTGNAFDVSRSRTINPLIAALDARRPPINISQLLDTPPNCGLTWGGTFINNYDPVHFFVP